MTPDCWCCACKHSRRKTREGCVLCWTNGAVQAWINGWGNLQHDEYGHTIDSRCRKDVNHSPGREFGCPPTDEPRCPGYIPRRTRGL